jgi:hypothetical protein
LLGSLACGGGDYAGAAVTAGAAVAAAGVYRAATDGCWAACAQGEECDEVSGMCVPAPCGDACPADWRCLWVDGQQQCVAPALEGAGPLEEVAGAPKSDKETNEALCLVAGITDCAAAPHPPRPPEESDDEEVDIVIGASP